MIHKYTIKCANKKVMSCLMVDFDQIVYYRWKFYNDILFYWAILHCKDWDFNMLLNNIFLKELKELLAFSHPIKKYIKETSGRE